MKKDTMKIFSISRMRRNKKGAEQVVHENFVKIIMGLGLTIFAVMALFTLVNFFIDKPDLASKYGYERLADDVKNLRDGEETWVPLYISKDYEIVANKDDSECLKRCLCFCSKDASVGCRKMQDKICFDRELDFDAPQGGTTRWFRITKEAKKIIINQPYACCFASNSQGATYTKIATEKECPQETFPTSQFVVDVSACKELKNIGDSSFEPASMGSGP